MATERDFVPIHTILQEEGEEGLNDANSDERKAEESQSDPLGSYIRKPDTTGKTSTNILHHTENHIEAL